MDCVHFSVTNIKSHTHTPEAQLLMPRIMTMNNDHHSVVPAPLDLRTTNRERGSAAASRTPDCNCCARDSRFAGGKHASAGTDNKAVHAATVRSVPCEDARTLDKSSSRLPFRKRPIPAEPEARTQTDDRHLSSTEELSPRGSAAKRVKEEENLMCMAPKRVEEPQQSGNGHPGNFRPAFQQYCHYPLYAPPLPDPSLCLDPTEHLLNTITLATRQDEDGDTALHIAVVKGELAVIHTLVSLLVWAQRGVDIYNNLRQTPLHLAVITQQAAMVQALLKAGADPAALDRNGQTALHLCCEYNQPDCMSVVLSHHTSSTCLDIRNYEGLSPLHLAVQRGHKDLTRMLLDAGADINVMDIKSGQSPLMHAVEASNVDMVHFLIESCCDVNGQSYSGNTALHSASGRGHTDMVRLLLKSGADSSMKNYHNDTPVTVAKNKKIADVLRGRGSKHIRLQDQHYVFDSPHKISFTDNGSPSPSHS
ncbi:B-cell lymphoma 3 protein homolog [Thalassophryne amazonica]|uniref:B-cell lymphoma 3 protein homolog n=1 Tax=Thalassophryne amazonica TaxID=390379 RepID=UPI0014708858|nr:B-cell lymphoma 3 protein homolog [Thalassophryne amazonica]